MAFGHLNFNDQTPHGRLLRRWLNGMESVLDDGADVLAVMAQMIDGDGSDPAHFTEVTARFGFRGNATSKAAWDEINSAMSKVTGDGSVTFVNAAIKQVVAKLR